MWVSATIQGVSLSGEASGVTVRAGGFQLVADGKELRVISLQGGVPVFVLPTPEVEK